MLVIYTTIPIDPDGEDALMEHIVTLVEHSQSEEGTVRYRAMRDLTDSNLIRFVEQYDDAESAEAHTESEAYRRFVEVLPEVVDGKIETVQYEVEDATVAEFTAEEAVAALD
jgi:quinol monooxygenase YgiN